MDSIQKVQEDQYSFPYHYIPEWNDMGFKAHKHWAWGLRYIGGLKIVSDICAQETFKSLIDVGCGDGRFLREMNRLSPGLRLKGIDYSETSIRYAKAFNPHLDYVASDITAMEKPAEQFDVLTLIEVVEHIPPEALADFIAACKRFVRPGGRMVITVPHANKPINEKHYQHFTEDDLKDVLSRVSDQLEFFYFDRKSRVLKLLLGMIGGDGNNYIVANNAINNFVKKYYFENALWAENEASCMRIGCVVRVS